MSVILEVKLVDREGNFVGFLTFKDPPAGDRDQIVLSAKYRELLKHTLLSGVTSRFILMPEFIPAKEFSKEEIVDKQFPITEDEAGTYMQRSRDLVMAYVLEHLDKTDKRPDFTVYIVWFSKTLQNWKALVSTTLPDGKYYEVTYNGDKKEAYVDVYLKVDNQCVKDDAWPAIHSA